MKLVEVILFAQSIRALSLILVAHFEPFLDCYLARRTVEKLRKLSPWCKGLYPPPRAFSRTILRRHGELHNIRVTKKDELHYCKRLASMVRKCNWRLEILTPSALHLGNSVAQFMTKPRTKLRYEERGGNCARQRRGTVVHTRTFVPAPHFMAQPA